MMLLPIAVNEMTELLFRKDGREYIHSLFQYSILALSWKDDRKP